MNVILILLIAGLGFVVVGPLIGFFLSLPFYPGSMQQMIEGLQDPLHDPGLKIPFYIMQGMATFVGLVVAPAIFLRADHSSLSNLFRSNKFDALPVLITFFTVIVFMAVNSVFIEWNAKFTFPEFAKGFEHWAREREDTATELTEFLTQFNSPVELAVAIVVIAILPAIGEELVFRGLIQNELHKATRNPHYAVWISAVLFSAIHLQFFGFIPRLLLGALFGYLYYWSGNLIMAIVAHFVNNGISVVAMYFYQKGAFQYDLESMESAPANVVVISTIVTAGLLYYFYKYFEHRKPALPQS